MPVLPHDNGNMITLDRMVYVREDQTLYGPNGEPIPGAGALIAGILASRS